MLTPYDPDFYLMCRELRTEFGSVMSPLSTEQGCLLKQSLGRLKRFSGGRVMFSSIRANRLSKSSIAKIEVMIEAVLANPTLYDQDHFLRETPCGTVCCAAGWAIYCNTPKVYDRLVNGIERGSEYVRWLRYAMEALELTSEYPGDIYSLFGLSSDWPDPFGRDYELASSPSERAKVFARRWRYFIAKDGME